MYKVGDIVRIKNKETIATKYRNKLAKILKVNDEFKTKSYRIVCEGEYLCIFENDVEMGFEEMKHQYKVGDVVIVNHCTDDIEEMQSFVGSAVTIHDCTNGTWNDGDHLAYHIKEDNGCWYWQEDWLIPVEEINITEDEIEDIFKE